MVAQGPERHGGAAGPILLCVSALLLRAGALEPLDDSTAEIAHSLEVGLHKIPDVIDPNQSKSNGSECSSRSSLRYCSTSPRLRRRISDLPFVMGAMPFGSRPTARFWSIHFTAAAKSSLFSRSNNRP